MSAWSEGYVNDINYTHGYYEELNPHRITIPFLMAGVAIPSMINACELGFGQGISVNMHAAASKTQWFATDFNPSQAHFAQHLAEKAGTLQEKILISDQGFSEFCQREDLPDFDFIGLHGIWSWISDENRHIIVDFLHRKLKVGGVLYISYNTLPGWSAPSPIRHLLVEHNQKMASAARNRAENAKDAVQFSEDVFNLSQGLIQGTPYLKERIAGLKNMSPNYLAHEYLNKDWHPMYFAQVETWLESAKLSYVCSTNYLDDFAPCLYDEEQKAFLDKIDNPSFEQTIKDYFVNKQFRRDYWVKGKRTLTTKERVDIWKKQRVMLLIRREDFNTQIVNYRTTQVLTELFDPVLDLLADGKIHAVEHLYQQLNEILTDEQLFSILAVLYAKNDLILCQAQQEVVNAYPACQMMNRYLLEYAQSSQDITHLVSPLSGGGIVFSYIERLFLFAHIQGIEPDYWQAVVWQILKDQRQLLIKDEKVLSTDEENLAEITRQKNEFLNYRFGLAKRLMVI